MLGAGSRSGVNQACFLLRLTFWGSQRRERGAREKALGTRSAHLAQAANGEFRSRRVALQAKLHIHSRHAALRHNYRIEIEFHKLGDLLSKARDAEQEIFERRDVCRRRSSISEEQGRAPESPDQFSSIAVR